MKIHILAASLILVFVSVASQNLFADERDDRIQSLEKRVEQLEKLLQAQDARKASAPPVEAPKPAEPPKPGPKLSVGENGFAMQSGDSNFVLRLRGILQVDSRTYIDDGGIKNNDMLLIRRARPIFEGTLFRDFDFRLQTDFAGAGAPTLRDAYLNYRYSDPFQLRFGKFKTPVGLEQLQSDAGTMFIERSLVSDITPSRDVGVQFGGKAMDGLVNYAIGVFNGVGDGRSSINVDTDDEKSFAGRLFVFPFHLAGVKPLQKLGIGVGGSFARTEGAASLPSGNGFATEGQQQFFTYRTSANPTNANVVADGNHWRISPQFSWYYGPWSALGEYVVSSQQLRRSDTGFLRTIENSAWQVAAGYVLTGEDTSDRGVAPRRSFNPHENSWGALEFVARLSSLDVDNAAFPLFANPATSATEAMAWSAGLNWYLNKNIRTGVNFFHTNFKGGQSGSVTAQDENAFLTRVQLAF